MLHTVKKIGCILMFTLLFFVGVTLIYIASQVLILPDESEVSSTLSQLYTEDQETRFAGIGNPIDIVVMMGGDWIRVNKVRRIVTADLLSAPQDYANAARILQHGDKSSDYLLAQELSLTAYELGEETMLRHSALAEDRYLVSIGQSQKYGSQFFCKPPDGWQLSPIDLTITDEVRSQVNIEPLSDMEEKIAKLNQATEGQCSLTMETMQQVGTIMDGE